MRTRLFETLHRFHSLCSIANYSQFLELSCRSPLRFRKLILLHSWIHSLRWRRQWLYTSAPPFALCRSLNWRCLHRLIVSLKAQVEGTLPPINAFSLEPNYFGLVQYGLCPKYREKKLKELFPKKISSKTFFKDLSRSFFILQSLLP